MSIARSRVRAYSPGMPSAVVAFSSTSMIARRCSPAPWPSTSLAIPTATWTSRFFLRSLWRFARAAPDILECSLITPNQLHALRHNEESRCFANGLPPKTSVNPLRTCHGNRSFFGLPGRSASVGSSWTPPYWAASRPFTDGTSTSLTVGQRYLGIASSMARYAP